MNRLEYMITRRTFLCSAAVMGAATALTPLFAQAESEVGAAAGASGGQPLPTNEPSTSGHYRPPYRFGLGGVAIGTGFNPTACRLAGRPEALDIEPAAAKNRCRP
jgi:D-threo-aldose 1-dehydrogenase